MRRFGAVLAGPPSLPAVAGAHRHDEFPAGYSLAGCVPRRVPFASSAGRRCGQCSRQHNKFTANGEHSLNPCLSLGGNPTFSLLSLPFLPPLPSCSISNQLHNPHFPAHNSST